MRTAAVRYVVGAEEFGAVATGCMSNAGATLYSMSIIEFSTVQLDVVADEMAVTFSIKAAFGGDCRSFVPVGSPQPANM